MSKTAELLQNQFEELQKKYEEQMILFSSFADTDITRIRFDDQKKGWYDKFTIIEEKWLADKASG